MATKYKQPKKLNPVSFLVILGVAALGYAAFQFGPPYWRQVKVKGALKNAAARYGKWGDAIVAKARRDAANEIHRAGVEDRGLQIHFRKTGGFVDAWAVYVEVVKHPFVNKITTMRFSPKVTVKRGGF